jgi:hypothetical protein
MCIGLRNVWTGGMKLIFVKTLSGVAYGTKRISGCELGFELPVEIALFGSTSPRSDNSFHCCAFLTFSTISGNLLLARSKPRHHNSERFCHSFDTAAAPVSPGVGRCGGLSPIPHASCSYPPSIYPAVDATSPIGGAGKWESRRGEMPPSDKAGGIQVVRRTKSI